MLGDRHRDSDDVGFLECVGTHQVREHLTGDGQQRNRVHVSVSYGGNQVGCTWTGGRNAHTGLAGSRGITLGSVASTLLVANQDVAQLLGVHQWVIDRKDGAAGQTKHIGHTDEFERAHNCFSTCQYRSV